MHSPSIEPSFIPHFAPTPSSPTTIGILIHASKNGPIVKWPTHAAMAGIDEEKIEKAYKDYLWTGPFCSEKLCIKSLSLSGRETIRRPWLQTLTLCPSSGTFFIHFNKVPGS